VILMATYTETIVPLPPITPEPTTPEPTTTTETPQTDPGSDSSPDDDKNDEEEDEEEDDNKTETTTEDETTTEPTIDEEEQEQEEEVDDEGEGDDEEEGDEDIEYEEDEAPSKKPGFGPGEEPSTEPTIDEVQNGEDGAPAATEDKPANGPTLSQTDDSLMTSAIPVTNYPPYPSAPPTPPPANSVTITTPGGDIVELEYHGQIPDSATLLPNGWGAAELDEGIWEIFGDDGKTIGFVWYDGENIKKWENFDEMILIETLLQTQEPFGNPAAGNETKEDKGNPNTGDVLPFAIVLALAGALPGIFAVKYKKKRS
ncbi:MAG: hypothetical protein FWD23_08130, partial [Oscillospiraceae bacterium]|nr:hypothetical protein [Oscillospiraceae bacterium]